MPASATEAIDAVTANSGAWGGSALPISAGPGIKVNLVNNTLVFSNDETVLWSGDISTSAASATFNENASNFEYLRIYGATNDSPPSQAFCILTPTSPIKSTFGLTYGSMTFNATWGQKVLTVKITDNQMAKYVEKECSWTTTAWSTGECNYHLYKVIGCNRISGDT